ncbi:alpha/beta fold hydrolase [Streptomyces sp. GbtcB6]|uniref:alpha/beta fold hydrolase n=1 Tax=Streptomyces sp. GbtcB6 TaxID=2824751 RepID=UPI001C2FAFC1|nr:alpha/beta fold hydrolase [Streptomyces sp. GbtcB6]
MREALAELLATADGRLHPEDLADVLWVSQLAGLSPLPTDSPARRPASARQPSPTNSTPRSGDATALETELPHAIPSDGGPPESRPKDEKQPGEPHVSLHALAEYGPATSDVGPAQIVQVARPSALPDSLALARALRPLRQFVDSIGAPELDEEATAQATSEARRLLPVWRPSGEPRFSVDLLVDTGATMAVWHRLASELYTMLERHSAFADVRCWAMDTDHPVPRIAPFRRRPPFATPPPTPKRAWHRALEDDTGRRVLLVLTDGVGPAWYGRELTAFLTRTSAKRPAAALQVLPQRLWHRTALRTASVEVSAADPNRPIPAFRSTAALPGIPRGARGALDRAAVRWLPVMEAKGTWLAPWAELTAGRSSGWTPMLAAPLEGVPRPQQPARAGEQSDSPAEQVTRFRNGSSPNAYRLACYLSAAPLSLPVMRLVQQTMMPESGQTDLAELFLSGLIERRGTPEPGGDPDDIVYDFRSGVREDLLTELTRGESMHVLDQVVAKVSNRVAATFGGVVDFRALAALAGTPGNAASGRRLPERSLPFAEVAVSVLRGAGGQYETLARQLAEGTQGHAPHDGVRQAAAARRVGLIFVHGFWSVPTVWEPFQRLIAQDPELDFVAPLLFEYETFAPALRARRLSQVSDFAEAFKTFLRTEAAPFSDLVLVSHSSGGLVVQRYLAQELTEGRGLELQKIRRIVMFACPSSSAQVERTRLRRWLRNPLERQLRLHDVEMAVDRRILLDQVIHANETGPYSLQIPIRSYTGESDDVVPATPETAVLEGDHITIIHPDSPAHTSYRAVKRDLLAVRADAGAKAPRDIRRSDDASITVEERLADPVVAMAALPQSGGRSLLALYSPDGTVRLWDPLNRAPIGSLIRLRAPGTVALASFPGVDGEPLLATIDGDGNVQIWDCTSGTPVGRSYRVSVTRVLAMTAFPADDGHPVLATSDYDGTVQLWAALDGTPRGQFTSAPAFLGRAMTAFPWQGGRSVLATADYTGHVRFWNLRGSRRRRLTPPTALEIQPSEVLAMAAFPAGPDGGHRLATVGYDDIVRLWDLPITPDTGLAAADASPILLRNLSLQAAVGLPKAVLEGCVEATAVRRKLAEADPATHLPELATSLHNLSIRYGAEGQSEEAVSAEEEATQIRRALASSHQAAHEPDLVRSLHNLSGRYFLAGRETAALAARHEAIALYRRRANRGDDAALRPTEELARDLVIHEQSLATVERTHGPSDPLTVTARSSLAAIYQEAGDVARAVFLLEQVVTAIERTLGVDHPHTIAARNNLAAVYEEDGNLVRAIPLYEENLAASQRALGRDHQLTRTIYERLAAISVIENDGLRRS